MPRDRLIKYAAYLLGIFLLLCVSYLKVFESFELQTLDFRFSLRSPLKTNPDIVIIEIAGDSLDELGAWPFDRGYHAALVNCLRQIGARAIAFDILFSEETPNDEEFIEAAQRARELVYFPVAFRLEEEAGGALKAKSIDSPLIEGLAKAARGVGQINIVTDIDGKRRRAPLYIEYEGKRYPQLGFQVAMDYLGGKAIKAPQGPDGTLLINYAGKWTKTFKHYSFVDVLKSYYQTVEGQQKPVLDLAEFYDKVCFVGVTAVGAHDLNPVPLESKYPMVGVQANIFNSVVQGKFLLRAGRLANIAALIALCAVIAIIVSRARPFRGLWISLLAVFLFMVASAVLFVLFGVWIDVFCPVVVACGVYLGGTFSKYLLEQRRRLLLDQELSIAKKIQLDFLPQSVPQAKGLEIAVFMATAKAVGGDLYDFAKFESGAQETLGIMVGDVSGKGVPAALFMARSIADFRHYVTVQRQPSSVLNELNTQIALNYKSGLFITMFYVVYDGSKKTLAYSNAGHLPAIWLKADGGLELLTTEGVPLGLVDTERYSDGCVELKPGDLIVLYTDGVTEARNEAKEEFKEERLKEVVLKKRAASAQAMVDAIREGLSGFVGSAEQYDDCTILVIKVV